jgi:hypothetical protein
MESCNDLRILSRSSTGSVFNRPRPRTRLAFDRHRTAGSAGSAESGNDLRILTAPQLAHSLIVLVIVFAFDRYAAAASAVQRVQAEQRRLARRTQNFLAQIFMQRHL